MTAEQGIRVVPSTKVDGHPSYEAFVYDQRQRRKIRRTFSDVAAARKWRKDMQARLRVAPKDVPLHDSRTLQAAMGEWLEKCRTGAVKSRRGLDYGHRTLDAYEANCRKYIFPRLGTEKFTRVSRRNLQDFVEHLNEKKLHGRTISNIITTLSAFFEYHWQRETITQNPASKLRLPDATSARRRVVSPEQAFALLDALTDDETRSAYALAFFCGLRRGEIRALDASGLRTNRVVVSHGFDEKTQQRVPLKWRKEGEERTIPRPKALDRYLTGLPGSKVAASTWRLRAQRQWKAAKLEGIDLHECRHSYAVWLDAAGISNSRADRYTGHSNPTMGEHYRNHPLTSMQLVADAEALNAYLDAQAAEVVQIATVQQ